LKSEVDAGSEISRMRIRFDRKVKQLTLTKQVTTYL